VAAPINYIYGGKAIQRLYQQIALCGG